MSYRPTSDIINTNNKHLLNSFLLSTTNLQKKVTKMTEPQKRVRKKPNLRVKIPSYPSDYVPMPPEVKHRYLEATGTPKDTPYLDKNTEEPLKATFQIGSPLSVKSPEDLRPSTPVIRIVEPKDEAATEETKEASKEVAEAKEMEAKEEEVKVEKEGDVLEADEEVVRRNPLRRSSISVPDGMKDMENLRNHYNDMLNVSAG